MAGDVSKFIHYVQDESGNKYGINASKLDGLTKEKLNEELDEKVDKEAGKQLSTNDYTNTEKAKLATVQQNAQENKIEQIKLNNSIIPIIDKQVDLGLIATSAALDVLEERVTATEGELVNVDARLAQLVTVSENLATAISVEQSRAIAAEQELDNKKQDKIADLDTIRSKATSAVQPETLEDYAKKEDLDGYATESWVEEQGYLKEHQDISGKADITYVDTELATKQNIISDLAGIRAGAALGATALQPDALTGYATEEWVEDQGYLKEHQDISGKADKSYVDNNFVPNSTDNDIVYVKNGSGVNTGVHYGQTATKYTIMWRDANGRSRIQAPAENDHIANKQYVDTEVSKKQDKLTPGANITIDENNVISASGQLASTEWGQITGTLSDQTDLQNAFDAKQATIEDLDDIRSKANSALQEVPAGYATESWVESKGYLTEHQSLDEYAKTADVDAKIAALPKVTFEKVDSLPDPTAEYVFAISRKIYLVPKEASEKDNYNEYICLDGGEEQEPRYYWELIGSTAVDLNNYYNKSETDELLAAKVDKVEGKQLSTEDYTNEEKAKLAELENYDDTVIKDNLSQVSEELATHTTNTDIHVTAEEKDTWDAKSDFSGSYNDLTDKPNIPVKTSDLTNDSGFITESALSGLATEEYVDTQVDTKSKVSVSSTGVATEEVKYIIIDDNEYKLAGSGSGSTYKAGDGIDITDDEISVDSTVAKKVDFADIITIDADTNTLNIKDIK